MRINFSIYMKATLLKIIFCLFLLVQLSNLHAQNFTHQASAIEFLDRMAQKGNIVFNDLMKPVDRTTVYNLLAQLQNKSDLLPIEKKEIAFYMSLYKFDNLNDTSISSKSNNYKFSYLHKNISYDPHVFTYTDKDFRIMADPVLETSINTFSKNSFLTSTGFQIMGYAEKRIGFQLSFRDVNETGNFDSTRTDNNLTGINRKTTTSSNLLNYAQFNATASYRFNKGMFTIGQDQHVLGYGKMGNIVLSDKAPSYPFVRMQYQPNAWLKFSYMHAWLQSGVINTTKTYGLLNTVYGGARVQYVPKFLATHFIEITPIKGLSINVGESIVYTDNLELPYLVPISFFKAYDNSKFGDNISAGANGQIFMGFSSRNQIPKTHLYGQLFIDEIRVGSMFNETQSRNQWAYQLGATVTDVYLPTLTFNAEYTRINPFVYRNFIPAQNYSSANYSLGDWMGANADRLVFSANYKLKANMSLKTYLALMTKGEQGTIEEQYFGSPQLPFGYNKLYNRTLLGLEYKYEVFNNLSLIINCIQLNQKPALLTTVDNHSTALSIGICWNKF